MKMIYKFEQFSPEIKLFFENLTLNNNKVWFDENRSFYEKEIKEKLKSFIVRMTEEFSAANLNYLADTRFSLFRINRDIRFSKNKNPYKTNLGIFFPYSHQPHLVNKDFSLGLYIHYEINNSFIATGMYNPDTSSLKLLRTYIAEEYKEFLKIIEDANFKKNFPELMSFQKPLTRLTGFDKEHPAIEHLKRKDFTYFGKIDDDSFFNANLIKLIISNASAGKDFMDFLYKAVY